MSGGSAARAAALAALVSGGLAAGDVARADAREDTLAACPSDALVEERFANGARWTLCTELRLREGLVLRDVVYTPPDGEPFRLLDSASLAQLHVAYDDSDVTYNDVTQYGLGGNQLAALAPADCPGGELRVALRRPLLCLTRRARGHGHWATDHGAPGGESLELLSVSQVGAYTYALSWTLGDDGVLAPAVGASGALQRSSEETTLPFGRVLAEEPRTLWLSHTHSYYWRLDIDLGASATDDVVVETRHRLDADGRRVGERERFVTERARRVEPDLLQLWQLRERADGLPRSASGPRGYRLEPLRHGHRFARDAIEPWAAHDLFVTVARDCERFASQNARYSPGCPDHVLDYVDGESLAGADLVLWHRVSFHHVPRNEDRRHMHTHWDGFRLEPLDLHRRSPALGDAADNTPPALGDALAPRRGRVGERVDGRLRARDADGDALVYLAEGLPPGIALAPDGALSGRLEAAGEYRPRLRVDDGLDTALGELAWTVVAAAPADAARAPDTATAGDGGESPGARGGRAAVGLATLLALALGLAGRCGRQRRRAPYTR